MELRRANAEDIVTLTEISQNAFHSDFLVGGDANDGPPGYDSCDWHKQMMEKEHLFVYVNDTEIIGGAVLFPNGENLYVGRIFISPPLFGQGYGKTLMKVVEEIFPNVKKINLDTPVWNSRTNSLYPKCGYTEIGRDEETVCYEKILKQSWSQKKEKGKEKE